MKINFFRADLDPQRWEQALAIRSEVFIKEQGVPESEEVDAHDQHDASCVHVLVEVDGMPAATGRIYEPSRQVGKIGRMAVLGRFRGRGTGMAILDVLIKEGRRRHLRVLELDAQVQALGFYAKRGFQPVGEPFLDCGIPHQTMRLGLALTKRTFVL